MISSRAPPYGLLSFHVQRSGEVHLRYGQGYDLLDPTHNEAAWVKKLKLHIEREAKKFIAQHQEIEK